MCAALAVESRAHAMFEVARERWKSSAQTHPEVLGVGSCVHRLVKIARGQLDDELV